MLKTVKKSTWVFTICLILFGYLAVSAYLLFSLSLPSLKEGVHELQRGQAILLSNPKEAANHFDRAGERFEFSSAQLQSAPLIFKLFTPLPPFRWQIQLLKATHALAGAGRVTSSLATSFPPLNSKEDKNINALLTHGSLRYFSFYQDHKPEIADLQSQLQEADNQLQNVPPWIGLTQRHALEDLQRRIHEINQALPIASSLSDSLQVALGSNDSLPHTLLILFQNNAELRPAGGFIGSYAVLTSSSGRIRNFSFGQNIYTLDKSLPVPRALPPLPLQTITNHWDFQDSNIGTGFLTESTTQIARFYEDATHVHVDGCIYIDTSVLEDILTITGPVLLPGSENTMIDAGTVRATLTNEIEKKYFLTPENQAKNQPKQIIADLMPAILTKVFSTPGVALKVINLAKQDILTKSIQFSLPSTEASTILQRILPLDTPPSSSNWLKIVNTNLGGQKSSLNVWQDVTVEQSSQPLKHRIIENITITRHHRGTGVWPDANNLNFMETYLPANAEITTEPTSIGGESQLPADLQNTLPPPTSSFPSTSSTNSWKKISWWGTTNIGQTTTYHLSYAIPSTLENENYFTYIKQAGSRHENLRAFSFNGSVNSNLFLTK